MQTDLHQFLTRLAGVVVATLCPVVLATFLTLPYQLERHPGEAPVGLAAESQHMT